MDYRHLGRSGLRVSELSFGAWITFGESLDLADVKRCMAAAFDHGVNFFDNAEAYDGGLAEILMGEALKEYRREDLVLSTKLFWGGEGPNDRGLSWKHLVEGTKKSLKRLQVDYLDLLYCHRPDPQTPVEETVRAMDHLIRQGYVFYWGTSEWPVDLIRRAHTVAQEMHCIPPSVEQPEYNLFHRRRVEVEYVPLFEAYGTGITSWSPLDMGILSGKYNSGIPEDSRLAQHEELAARLTEDKIAKVRKLSELAREIGCTPAQLAIAWCLKNSAISSVITGATHVDQVRENMESVRFKEELTDDVLSRINEIVG